MDKLLVNLIIIKLILIYPTIVLSLSSYYNVIDAKSSDTSKKYCIIDYVLDQNSTKHQKRDNYYSIENQLSEDFCRDSGHHLSDKNLTNKFVLINYSKECDINEQIDYFSNYSINGLFISISCNVDIDSSINITNNTLIDNQFSVSLIADSSVDSLIGLRLDKLKLFDVNFDNDLVRVDFSMVVIWFLATFTVVLGSFWSGVVRLQIFQSSSSETTESTTTNEAKETAGSKPVEEEPFLNISPIWVLCFVVGMALMLLALYYFFQYLIYVIIALFTMASIASIFACCEPILLKVLPKNITKPSFKLFTEKCGKMFFYQLVLLVFAFGVSITWLITRKESYSWSIQDILGVCFSLNMLRTIRLPSYKICVILLSLLFFYDIFFVFITPLITSKGNSVMVDVATGGSTKSRCGKPGEQLPMVLRVPHQLFRSDSNDPLDVCFPNRDSILGFGDILVPGLLVSYCHAFDLIFGIKYRIYYITTCISYGLGLIATFAGLYLMSGSAQPALLYLVPFTIIPPLLIATYRKEFKQLWSGPEAHLRPLTSATKMDNSIDDVNREDNLLIDGSQSSVPTNSS